MLNMTRLLKPLVLLLLLGLGTAGYTQVMLRKGSGTPPPMAPAEQQADAIHVDKSDRQPVSYTHLTLPTIYSV